MAPLHRRRAARSRGFSRRACWCEACFGPDVSRAVTFASCLLVLACTRTQQGRVYSLQDGHSARVTARRPFGGGGTLDAELPDGRRCSGPFRPVPVGSVASLGACQVPLTENAEASVALLTCGAGGVLRCTLARRYDDGLSYGACEDGRGARYDVVF